MKLTIDFETRSCSALGQEGPWKYAQDPSTEVLCLAVKIDKQPPRLWAPTWVRQAVADPSLDWLANQQLDILVSLAQLVEAHNVEFERAIWTHVMRTQHQMQAELPVEKCACSAAKAAAIGLPRDLASACKVVGTTTQKDAEGHKIMLKLCKPRAPHKSEISAEKTTLWHEDPADLRKLLHYCLRDVEAEHSLSEMLPNLSPEELEIWRIDQRSNELGVAIDLPTVNHFLDFIADHRKTLTTRLQALTGLTSGSQVAQLLAWLRDHGLELPSLDREAVASALKQHDLDPAVREVLEIRRSLARSSIAKYQAMLRRTSADGRARSLLMYCGASTGRWTGKAIQVQNLPRGKFADVDACIAVVNKGPAHWPLVEEWWCDPTEAASTCLRGMLVPAPGKDFLAADFSAIEGRVLAWLAGDRRAVQVYLDRKDPYKTNAARTYGVPYEEVSKAQRQVGKVQELALGYGGGIGAFASMGKNYGLEVAELERMLPALLRRASKEMCLNADKMAKQYLTRETGTKLSMNAAMACDLAKQLWRAGRPVTTQYWQDLEKAATAAVASPGQRFVVRNCVWWMSGRYLCCRLPSGRSLWYCGPDLRTRKTPWDEDKLTLHYWGNDSETHQWSRQHTYGGKLAENVTQAVARDLLRDAIRRMDALVYSLAFHVHDEIVVEAQEGEGDLDSFCRHMAQAPYWAAGLPIAAEGWRGKRYRKG